MNYNDCLRCVLVQIIAIEQTIQLELHSDRSHRHTNQRIFTIMELTSDNSVTIMANERVQKYYFTKYSNIFGLKRIDFNWIFVNLISLYRIHILCNRNNYHNHNLIKICWVEQLIESFENNNRYKFNVSQFEYKTIANEIDLCFFVYLLTLTLSPLKLVSRWITFNHKLWLKINARGSQSMGILT